MRIQHYESKYRDINKAEALVVYKLALGLGCDVSEILELPEDICQVKNSTKNPKKEKKRKLLPRNSMILVVAEKPSVGRNIAAIVGANKTEDGYIEGNNYICDMGGRTSDRLI